MSTLTKAQYDAIRKFLNDPECASDVEDVMRSVDSGALADRVDEALEAAREYADAMFWLDAEIMNVDRDELP